MAKESSFVPGFTKKFRKKKKRNRNKDRHANGDAQFKSVTGNANAESPELRDIDLTEVVQGWVPPDEVVEVAGRRISGMVYICDSRKKKTSDAGFSNSFFCIDVAKPAIGKDRSGHNLDYCNYRDLTPSERGSYLDWLADGKRDTRFNPIYVLMYFAGLEYKLLKDECTELERKQVLDEIRRLKSVFGVNRVINPYFSRIFDLTDIVFAKSGNDVKHPNMYVRIPFLVQAQVIDKIHEEKGLSGEELFNWFSYDYEHHEYNSYPLNRLKDRFLEKFAETYPNGMEVETISEHLTLAYGGVNFDFMYREPVTFKGRPFLDIDYLCAPLHKAEAILDEVTQDMFNKDVEKGKRKRNSVSLLEFAKVGGGKFNGRAPIHFLGLLNWARRISRDREQISTMELNLKLNEGETQSNLNPSLKEIADALALIGIGMAPHTVFASGKSVHPEQPVFLYESKDNHCANQRKHALFMQTIVRMMAGAQLYQVCGYTSDEIRMKLKELATSTTGLKKNEKHGALAHMEYLMLVPPAPNYLEANSKHHTTEFLGLYKHSILELSTHMGMRESKRRSILNRILG